MGDSVIKYVYIYMAIIVLFGLISLVLIFNYKDYKRYFNYIYAVKRENKGKLKHYNKNVNSSITIKEEITSNKEGYDYLHEIFIKRHRKILTTPIILFSSITVGLILILLYFTIKYEEPVGEYILTNISFSLIIMYAFNRGLPITKAMFVNCDMALLNYRLYRTPKVILEMFRRRLYTLVKLNMIPAIIIGVGIDLVLYFSNIASVTEYLIILLCMISISTFFSVHYLVLYYLLQPFNINTDAKNKVYNIISVLTYFVCYILGQFSLELYQFCIYTIFFTIFYLIIALKLVKKYAPNTFKIYI